MSLTNFFQDKPWVVDVSAECTIHPIKVEGLPGLDTTPSKAHLKDKVVVWAKSIKKAREAVEEGIRATYNHAEIAFHNTHPYEGTDCLQQSRYFPSLNSAF
ncbi:MAG: hypothetical protein KKD18_04555 [Nanoarchaeota archaeon]|nr:hypothetical protein [Nanoarchaeota archaeon]MBU0977661.1 hypothetical protein [Nanoarchaeota archaeon]